jgi:hypothetical protein
MTEPRNMDEPVTRRELHEVLESWGAELERRITANVTESVTANVTAAVTANVTAAVTANVTAAVTANVTAAVTEKVTAAVTANVTANLRESVTADVIANLTANVPGSLYTLLSDEMARQIQASEERNRDFMRALFEPYDDHPKRLASVEELRPRVERLEAKVFAPKRSSQSPKRRAAKRR